MTPTQIDALNYIDAVDDGPKIKWFDEDFEPIGPRLRQDLLDMGAITERCGRVFRVSAGGTI